MAYQAFLVDVVEYQGTINVKVEFREVGLPILSQTFSYAFSEFSVAQARSDIIARRDKYNQVSNKVAQLKQLIGQEVT